MTYTRLWPSCWVLPPVRPRSCSYWQSMPATRPWPCTLRAQSLLALCRSPTGQATSQVANHCCWRTTTPPWTRGHPLASNCWCTTGIWLVPRDISSSLGWCSTRQVHALHLYSCYVCSVCYLVTASLTACGSAAKHKTRYYC